VIVLQPDFRARLVGRDRFDDLMTIEGEIFKHQAGRRTLRFTREGKSYFIKQHFGVGWKEIIKNLVRFRLPVVGATDEQLAIERLTGLGIATMKLVGYGMEGRNPAKLRSFIVTEALDETETLETLCAGWKARSPDIAFKRELIRAVATTARRLHENGVNHRDFYLCHLRLSKNASEPRLFVMDLHRAQLRRQTPRRWKVKDLAALHFSSMDIGLTRRDLYRFIKVYRSKTVCDVLASEAGFWRDVERAASRLYRRSAHSALATSQPLL
jgi:hypothetical protein